MNTKKTTKHSNNRPPQAWSFFKTDQPNNSMLQAAGRVSWLPQPVDLTQVISYQDSETKKILQIAYYALVTPNQALEILSVSEGANIRKIPRNRMIRYADDMKNAKFRSLNGQVLYFRDSDFKLIDGQTRLAAILETESTMPFLIVIGQEEPMDLGAARTAGLYAKNAGYNQSNTTAAVARKVLLLERLESLEASVSTRILSVGHVHIMKFLEDHREELCQAVSTRWARPFKKVVHTSTVCFFFWLILHKDLTAAEKFLEVLSENKLDVPASHPAVAVVRQIHRISAAIPGRDKNISDQIAMALLIKSWNAYRNNQPITGALRYEDVEFPTLSD